VMWIKWVPHSGNVLKMNVDGASNGRSGLSGGRMVIKNSKGHVVLAAATYYEMGSNMLAECRAMLDGLQLIRKYGMEDFHFLLESVSKVLVQMILGQAEVPWRVKSILEKIWNLLHGLPF
ncbi:unnamed protein product, partial [Ilex paraguariensis]